MSKTTLTRVDDVMVEVKVKSALIDFNDILDHARIEEDDDSRAPWEDCDGFEHYATYTAASRGDADPRLDTELADTNAMRGSVWVQGRDFAIITIDHYYSRDWGPSYKGMSKQVRAEAEARNVQVTIDQLVDWYKYGWESYGVVCEYGKYEDSCWGYDDLKYAESQRVEHALEVARQMESDGYTVYNKPQPEEEHIIRGRTQGYGCSRTREQWRQHFKGNLKLDCWK